ncbi:MAG: hypothetical protein ACMUIG_04200 [Thermoplasmatota archaeon]
MKVPRSMLILLLMIAILSAGCFEIDEIGPDPEEGDLVLTISMDIQTYEVRPDSMMIGIELKNAADHAVVVEEAFSFGSSLFPTISGSNGSTVLLSYPIMDYSPDYSLFEPGEKKTREIDLAGMAPEMQTDTGIIDFDWSIPDVYEISIGYWGSRNPLEVRSNTITFEIAE